RLLPEAIKGLATNVPQRKLLVLYHPPGFLGFCLYLRYLSKTCPIPNTSDLMISNSLIDSPERDAISPKPIFDVCLIVRIAVVAECIAARLCRRGSWLGGG